MDWQEGLPVVLQQGGQQTVHDRRGSDLYRMGHTGRYLTVRVTPDLFHCWPVRVNLADSTDGSRSSAGACYEPVRPRGSESVHDTY